MGWFSSNWEIHKLFSTKISMSVNSSDLVFDLLVSCSLPYTSFAARTFDKAFFEIITTFPAKATISEIHMVFAT